MNPLAYRSDLSIRELRPPLRGSHLNRDASRACLVADSLAYAVRHQLPLPVVLRSLPFYMPRRVCFRDLLCVMGRVLDPPFFRCRWPGFGDAAVSYRIDSVIRELEAGSDLSAALRLHLKPVLPPYFIAGVQKAEGDGTLETVLPLLAEQMVYPDYLHRETMHRFFIIAGQLLIFFMIINFLNVFIIPKFQEIMEDMGATGGGWLPCAMGMGHIFGIFCLLVLATLVLICVQSISSLAGSLMSYLPGIGYLWRKLERIDTARSIAGLLDAGLDVTDATLLAESCSRSFWMRHKLQRYARELRSGTHWVEAWQKVHPGRYLETWLLRNADAREDPRSGFDTMARWLQQDLELKVARIEQWIYPVFSILIGTFIGSIAYYFFSSIVQIHRTLY